MREALFSYGTLQLAEVQRALFDRTLEGMPDALDGFGLVTIETRDPAAVATSGVETHHALVADPGAPRLPGMLYTLSVDELAAADRYEGDDYRRLAVRFVSGREGWVYVRA